MDQLDELRVRLGILPEPSEGSLPNSQTSDQGSLSSSQENMSGISPLGNGSIGGVVVSEGSGEGRVVAFLDSFPGRQLAYQQEMERLHKAGDNADGLEEVRLAFRRAGR